MPTYEYRCGNYLCKHQFDVFQQITEKPGAVCPECDCWTSMRLISGGAGIIFKGKGWPGKSILRGEQNESE
jgi:putative FmdB family regulatory protein